MKTNLDRKIQDTDQAIAFLTELYRNGESYHPEDDAHDIVWNSKSIWGGSYGIPKKDVPTFEDENKLNHLMEQCFIHCDPCEILIDLDEKTNP